MNFIPMFITGLVTSVHCVAMCGTLVACYAVTDAEAGAGWRERVAPSLVYQSAKISSYVAVGLVLGSVGAVLGLGGVRGWVTVAAGAFMVLLGLNMTGLFPVLRHLTLRPPRSLVRALSFNRRKAAGEAAAGHVHLATPLVFGLLTGLMPCGPLQAAQLYAAGTGSALAGAVAMLGFGLGTAPLMLAFGVGSGMLGEVFKKRMVVAGAVVVMALGLVMVNRGAAVLGWPVTFESVRQAAAEAVSAPTSVTGFRVGADGVTEVPLTIRGTRYVPETVRVPAGRRVRLLVDRQEDVTCSDQLAVPQLGVLVELKPFATTAVELPAANSGRYTLTCGMGMMSGSLVVGTGTSPTAVLLLTFAALVVAGGALGLALARRRRATLATRTRR